MSRNRSAGRAAPSHAEWQLRLAHHKLDATVDVPDVRDQLYQPPLDLLPTELVPWEANWWNAARVRDQDRRPSCVGHALAAVVDHLRARSLADAKSGRDDHTLRKPWASWRMLYHTAKYHDEWMGENYRGTSIRGGLKGFFYNGVCAEEDEPRSRPDGQSLTDDERDKHWYMTKAIVETARTIQLGAYYRVRPRLSDMHSALNEAKVLIVSAAVHEGWAAPAGDAGEPTIAWDRPKRRPDEDGGERLHAFAVVGYDDCAFWVQNSWGLGWGRQGCARWLYEDWAANVVDAWVLHLAVLPPSMHAPRRAVVTAHGSRINRAETHFLGQRQTDHSGPSRLDVLGHMLPFRDGKLDRYGPYNVDLETLRMTFGIIRTRAREPVDFAHGGTPGAAGADNLRYRHVLIYFLGGWPDETALANQLRDVIPSFTRLGIYPLFLTWETELFGEFERLVRRAIEEVDRQVQVTPGTRRSARDRLVEGHIAAPGNRLLRELRASAKRLFACDQPDPDRESRPVCQGGVAEVLGELFAQLGKRFSKRTISYHFATHGFGAQLLAECLAEQNYLLHQEAKPRFPQISTCTLISPTLSCARARGTGGGPQESLFSSLLARNDSGSGVLADHLALARVRLLVLSSQAMHVDRFSDEYGHAWPRMCARVMGRDPALAAPPADHAAERGDPVLPVLSDPHYARAFAEEAQRDGCNVLVRYVSAIEDEADSSLHHEMGFHPQILQELVAGMEAGLSTAAAQEFDTRGFRKIKIDDKDSNGAAAG